MSTKRDRIASDTLNHSIIILETLSQASDVIGVVPLVGTIIGACVSLLRAIENVKIAQDRSNRLARRITKLAEHVHETVHDDIMAVDARLETSLLSLLSTLDRICSDVEKLRKRRGWVRFLRHSSISDTLDEHADTLDAAWRSFDTCCLISLRQKMDRQIQHQQKQAVYDDQQYRLFRASDLILREVSGSWYISDVACGEEWKGEWDGRAVAIRIVNDIADPTVSSALLCRTAPKLYHPRIAQVLGYSHPDLEQRFYVLETGSVPLLHCYSISDTRTKLITWLETMLDHQAACRSALPLLADYPYHDCYEEPCLQTATLDANGKLLLTMDDLIHGSFACMWRSWVRQFDQRMSHAKGDYIPYDADVVREMLSCVKDGSTKSRVTFDWTYLGENGIISNKVAPGDYGYMCERSGDFVRLGNIVDLLDGDHRLADGIVEAYHYVSSSDQEGMVEGLPECIPVQLTAGETHINSSVSLKHWCKMAYWDQIESISRTHHLPIHSLMIIDANVLTASAYVVSSSPKNREVTTSPIVPQECSTRSILPVHQQESDKSSAGTANLYFHRVVSKKDLGREVPRPWGHWSLDPESCPGPWPDLNITGLELQHCSAASWHRLTVLEAELYLYLRRQEKACDLSECWNSVQDQ